MARKLSNFLERHVEAGCTQDCECSGNLDRRGRTESGAKGHVSFDSHRESVAHGETVFAQRPEDTGDIVGPMGFLSSAEFCEPAIKKFVQRMLDVFVVV